MSLDGENWFTELCEESGSAFSLQTAKKLHDAKTPYQHIQVFETTHFGNLLVLDGLVMLSARDNFIYHEMMTHPALFIHPNPRHALIIGGGDCGCLNEALKHQTITKIDQVELDEQVTRVSEQYFAELCRSNNDPRASFHFLDGIDWIERAAPGSYDVIIVDSTDPIGQAARLFAAPFYRACREALRDNGVLIVQSESPLIHLPLIESIRGAMSDAGFTNIDTLNFPQCTYPSGWWSATLASMRGGHRDFRLRDAAQKPFATRYYNAEVHQASLASPEFLRTALTNKLQEHST